MKKAALFIYLIILSSFIIAQNNIIDVTDQQALKIKAGKPTEFYYGFTAGDKIIFSVELIEGKQLKQVEIFEYPNISRFSLANAPSINETLPVSKEGIYKFVLSGPLIGWKMVKLKIQRIPASDATSNFNTAVEWKTKFDTSYVNYTMDSIVGYDTTYSTYTNKEVVGVDTSFQEIFTKMERVHSSTNLEHSSRTLISITIPEVSSSYYKATNPIAWSYCILVGNQGLSAFDKAKQQFLTDVTVEVSKKNPLWGLAIGAASYLVLPTVGDNVQYWFIQDYNNAQLFYAGSPFNSFVDKGDGILASGRSTSKLSGTFYLGLYNDNIREGIDVTVKIGLVSLITEYVDKEYQKQHINARKVTLNKVRTVLTPIDYPVIMQTDPNAFVTYATDTHSNSDNQTLTTNTNSTNKFSIGDSVAFEVSGFGYIIGAIKTIDGENLLVEYFDNTNKKIYDKKAMKDVMLVSSKNGSNSNSNPSGSGNETVNDFYVGEDVVFLSDSYIPAENVPGKIIKFSSDKLSVDIEYIVFGKAKVKTVSITKVSKK